MRKKRVLFFAEAVTLAHVARPIVLAGSLGVDEFEPIVACHPRCDGFFAGKTWTMQPLQSIGSEQFLGALARGSPVFDTATLRRYVSEDLRLIERLEPDLVVGDFRISLSISARLAGVPYATVTNAYWSPYCARQAFPMPELPLTRWLPIPFAELLFRWATPVAMAVHCGPMNTLRREHGLPSLGPNLRRVYTDADHVLYADAPALFPMRDMPGNHRFLGPVLWSPPVDRPEWWGALPSDRPIVYMTLGSSGHARTVATVIDVLGKMPVTVIAATAGLHPGASLPSNVFAEKYLPGVEAAARSSLVICNGGSPTSQQAVAAGVPMLCIASNADQFLNAAALAERGCAITLRADRLNGEHIRAAVDRILASSAMRSAARDVRRESASHEAQSGFVAFARALCGESWNEKAKPPPFA